MVALSEIITTLIERHTRLTADDIDVTDLEDIYINGYTRTRVGAVRSDVDIMRMIGLFDVIEADTKLVFRKRGGASVVTFSSDELGVTTEDADASVKTVITQRTELPARLAVLYRSRARDYDKGSQPSPSRLESGTKNFATLEIAAHLSDDMAAQLADIHYRTQWAERFQHETSVSAQFAYLRQSDPVTLPVDGRNYRCRITEMTDESVVRKLALVRDDDGNYTSSAVAASPVVGNGTVLQVRATTAMILLDIPMLRPEDNNAGFWVAAWPYTSGMWAGAGIYRDTGSGYSQVGTIQARAIAGAVDVPLGSADSEVMDTTGELTVTLARGSLASITYDQLQTGGNLAAVGVHGRWEIIQFQTVEQLDDYQYKLTNILRGRRGTEAFIGTGIAADAFVMLNDAIARIPLQDAQIGVEYSYKAVSVNGSIGNVTAKLFTGEGEALRPFSPVHIKAEWAGATSTITWTRRSRYVGEILPSGAEVPLLEDTEEYDVELYVSSTLVDSGTVTTPEFISTAGTEGATEVRVYQRSATFGRGRVGVVTV